MARKYRRRQGTLLQTQKMLWRAITAVEAILDAPDSNAQTLQVCHALSQACSSYSRLLEVGQFEARLLALEALVKRGGGDAQIHTPL